MFYEEFKKWITRVVFTAITAILIFLFTPLYENLKSIWEVPERLTVIEDQISDLKTTTDSLTGEDRIIRQQPKLSYVEEPVYLGDNVAIIIVAQKTALGQTCTLEEMQALFTDETRITTPGQFPKYTRKIDLTSNPTTSRVEIIPPPNLKTGRVQVYLVLEFDCNGTTRFDRTEILTFQLLNKPH